MNLSNIEYLDCEGPGYLEPYDPRCRGWYINAMKYKGNNLYKPYQDAFSKEIIMTGSARIDDKDGNNISVISVDFVIKNLIQKQFYKQDQQEQVSGTDSYTVLFHVDKNTVYHHKYWNNSEYVLKSWEDLEFNSTMNFDPSEKSLFLQSVERSKLFSLTQNFTIIDKKNIENFYQFWAKNGTNQQKY